MIQKIFLAVALFLFLGVVSISSVQPEVSIKSSLGVSRKAGSRSGFTGRGEGYEEQHEAVHEEGSAVADAIVLGLPVLFLPALLLALLYLIWGGVYSSHNYHNHSPAYGIGIASGPPQYHYGGGAGPGSGYHYGKFNGPAKFDGKEELARSVQQLTPKVLSSI